MKSVIDRLKIYAEKNVNLMSEKALNAGEWSSVVVALPA